METTATTPPDPALVAAYEACCYRVHLLTGTVDIQVGHACPALTPWLTAHGATQWALLTACNPRSVQLTRAENDHRQSALQAALAEAGWPWCPGENLDPGGHWPAEASCLVAGLELASAQALAQRFDQHGFLWGRLGAEAQLIWADSVAA